jgi:sulfide:quinone oxidoreductase
LRLAGATAVDRERRALLTTAGEVAYDSLLVAVGAKPREAVPGALTFRGAGDVPRVDAVLHDAALGRLERIVFALPGGACWPLPLYELALLARAELVDRGITSVEIVLVTPEERPLAVFGAATSEAIADLLEIRGIELRAAATIAEHLGSRTCSRSRRRAYTSTSRSRKRHADGSRLKLH